MVDHERERQKWDALATDWPEVPAGQQALAAELAALLGSLDPPVETVLEAGCGSGLTGAGLAHRGFHVDLLDFSAPMLASAERAWARHGPQDRRPRLVQGDLFAADPAALGVEPYDCVFNAGVLEHYDDAEIMRLLRGMARLSRRWVVALVPNSRCAAYRWWKWHHERQGTWTFGRELPRASLAEMNRRAGLQTVLELPLAHAWTHDFVDELERSAPDVAAWLRSDELPPELTGYLLCSVARVCESGAAPPAGEPGGHDAAAAAQAWRALAERLHVDLGALQDRLRTLRTAAEHDRARRDEIEAELADVRAARERLAAELAEQRQVAAIVDDFARAKQARVRALQDDLTARSLERRRAEREGARVEAELARVRASYGELAQRLDETRRRIAAVRGELEHVACSKTVRALGWARLLGPGAGPWRPRARFAWQRLRGHEARVPVDGPLDAQLAALDALSHEPGMAADPAAAVADAPRIASHVDAVHLVTPLFLDRRGDAYLFGGAERYHLELARVIADLGYRPILCQSADHDWQRSFDGLEIAGIRATLDPLDLGRQFHRRVAPGALAIYSSFFLASAASHARAIGVSHGVFWDHATFQEPAARAHWSTVLRDAMDRCQLLVSVDANTINQVRAHDVQRAAKWIRIPNFVDLDVFRPAAAPEPTDRLTVLYPRRLYGPRGFWLVAEIAPAVLARFPSADLWFVGQAEEREAAKVAELQRRFPGRVRHETLAPHEMAGAYRRAAVTLIPTVNSEGTSLSCLEAMASGNAVIATDVGGLPELVVDGDNGLLVSPTPDALRTALERLLGSPELRAALGRRARATAAAHAKTRWQERWRDVLAPMLPARSRAAARRDGVAGPSPAALARTPAGTSEPPPLTWIHVETPGIRWSSMKQRPHHLFEALARSGQRAVFVSDTGDDERTLPSGLRLTRGDRAVDAARPVLYLYYAYHQARLADHPGALVVYDVLDDPAIHDAADAHVPSSIDTFRDHHEKLIERADVLVTSSRRLADSLRARRPDVRLIPNGVWPEHFAGPFARPDDLPPAGVPVVGYYGALAEWFDWELVHGCARALPDWHFRLIGPSTDDQALAALCALPNVVHDGEKPYEQLAAYAAHFDVGIVPFVVNAVTDAVSPLKLFEYAAAGTPIVATGFAEARTAGPTLVGDGLLPFVAQLRRAIELGRDSSHRAALRAFAAESSWTQRARVLHEAVEQVAARRVGRSDPAGAMLPGAI